MHVLFALYGSPKKLRIIEDWVNNNLVYEWEGRLRRGFHRPFLSKAPFGLYDVRIKKELAPQFIRDLGLVHPSDPFPRFWSVEGFIHSCFRIFSFCLRLFTPLVLSPKARSVSRRRPRGWLYGWYLGSLPDKHFDGQESL